jgi:hypothetical protein
VISFLISKYQDEVYTYAREISKFAGSMSSQLPSASRGEGLCLLLPPRTGEFREKLKGLKKTFPPGIPVSLRDNNTMA